SAPVTTISTNGGQVEPMQPANQATPEEFKAGMGAPVVQNLPVVGEISLAQQTATQTARRDASLLAGIFATVNDRGINGAGGLTTQLAGNGADLGRGDRDRDPEFNSQLQSPELAGKVSFASTVRDFQSEG